MDVKTLIGIIENRMKTNDSNPTRYSLLYEIHKALKELEEIKNNKAAENPHKLRGNEDSNTQ